MNARKLIAAVMFVAALPAFALAQDVQPRPIVTIAQFDTGRTGWVPPAGFGETMAELLGQRLVTSGQYRVLDAEFLGRDIAPPPHQRLPLEALRERAERAGVRYLILGSLTEYSREQKQRTAGGAALIGLLIGARFHAPVAPLAGGFRRTSFESVLALSIRMIDVQTGEVVTTAIGQGAAARTNRSATAFGAVAAPFAGGYSNSSSGANEAMLNEALVTALDELAGALVQAAPRLARGSGD